MFIDINMFLFILLYMFSSSVNFDFYYFKIFFNLLYLCISNISFYIVKLYPQTLLAVAFPLLLFFDILLLMQISAE